MTDRVGFFTGCADVLTEMCVYYVVAGVFIMSNRGWGLHLVWLLLCALACALIFAALLKKPRSTPFLTVITGVLFLAVMAVFLLASETPARFGYVFVLAVGGGMAVGLPLYYGLNRPIIRNHLTHLDVLIMAMLVIMLCRQALDIDGGTVALMAAVLFMDAAGAVGLRMSDGGEGSGAFRATMIALCAAVAVALVIGLLTLLFSRSGAVTDSVLHGVGGFFAAVGGQIERFFRWLSGRMAVDESFEAVPVGDDIPSVAASEGQAGAAELSVNTTAVGVVVSVLVAAAAVFVAVILRKKRFSREMSRDASASGVAVSRSGGTLAALWQAILARLRFRWTAFVLRDTPAGLLVLLERLGKRAHTPRQTGESMRHYIRRMDESGGLDELSDALDREYYGGMREVLPAKRCRELRKYMRKAVQHG